MWFWFALLCFSHHRLCRCRFGVNTSCTWVVGIPGRSARLQCLRLCQERRGIYGGQLRWRIATRVGDCEWDVWDTRRVRRGKVAPVILESWLKWKAGRGSQCGRAPRLLALAVNRRCSTWQRSTVAFYFSFFLCVCARLCHVVWARRPRHSGLNLMLLAIFNPAIRRNAFGFVPVPVHFLLFAGLWLFLYLSWLFVFFF